jgi:hypothetical protein
MMGMRHYSTRGRVAAGVAIVAGGWSAAARGEDPRRAHFWVEIPDTVITPGEFIDITLWMRFEPKAPTVLYNYKGKDRQIAGFGRLLGMDLNVIAENGVGGTWSVVWINDDLSPLSDIGAKYPNKLVAIRLDNFLPYEYPGATKENPLWMLRARWTPDSYEETSVKIEVVPPLDSVWIAAYTLPNLVYPPFPVQYDTSARVSVVTIQPEACVADCDNDNGLTIDDFVCFQTLFAIGDPLADCDGDGQLLIDDFLCFQTYFAIGC